MRKVIEFKHHSPYNGCYWQWQYLYTGMGTLEPIVWYTDKDKDNRYLGHPFPNTIGDLKKARYASDITVHNWDQDLYKLIPHNWEPEFWKFAQENDLEFAWNCDRCGLTTDRPTKMSGYRGNGGIGIEVSGWYCEECYYSLSCSYCGSVNDPDSAWWDYDEDLVKEYDAGDCPSCHNER